MQPSIHLLKSVRPTDITYHPSPEPHSFTPLAISSRRRASARADAPLPVQVLALLAAALCRDGPVIVPVVAVRCHARDQTRPARTTDARDELKQARAREHLKCVNLPDRNIKLYTLR